MTIKRETPTVETKDLTKFFGGIKAVVGLNLTVYSGETFGLLGPNGAGKTTTVRMLNAIIKPTRGTAIVGGYDVVKQPIMVKRITGFLPETAGVYDKLTAREFLYFIGRLYDVPKEDIQVRSEELFELLDLNGREDDLLESYSRGMKQKILIASTLIHDPEIIFLDEPTATLDPASARTVKDTIKYLSEMGDKTIFLCTHILSVAEELCKRVGIIDKGKLLAVGSPSELMEMTETDSLEDAFLKITKRERKSIRDMLGWT
ncbi:MAG: ABC transporter ATP-binding protein [Candidatus Asgardarchaeia archaeon]